MSNNVENSVLCSCTDNYYTCNKIIDVSVSYILLVILFHQWKDKPRHK